MVDGDKTLDVQALFRGHVKWSGVLGASVGEVGQVAPWDGFASQLEATTPRVVPWDGFASTMLDATTAPEVAPWDGFHARAAPRGGFATPPKVSITTLFSQRRAPAPRAGGWWKESQITKTEVSDDIEEAVHEGNAGFLTAALTRSGAYGSEHLYHAAVRRRHPKSVDLLIKESVPGLETSFRGTRPVHLAVQECCPGDVATSTGMEMLSLLLKHGASVKPFAGDDLGFGSPLHMAVKRGCSAAVRLLLAQGADPNGLDANGRTPLHVFGLQAKYYMDPDHLQVLQALLKADAEPRAKDSAGYTAAQYAKGTLLQARLLRAEAKIDGRCFLVAAGPGHSPSALAQPEVMKEVYKFLAGDNETDGRCKPAATSGQATTAGP